MIIHRHLCKKCGTVFKVEYKNDKSEVERKTEVCCLVCEESDGDMDFVCDECS